MFQKTFSNTIWRISEEGQPAGFVWNNGAIRHKNGRRRQSGLCIPLCRLISPLLAAAPVQSFAWRINDDPTRALLSQL